MRDGGRRVAAPLPLHPSAAEQEQGQGSNSPAWLSGASPAISLEIPANAPRGTVEHETGMWLPPGLPFLSCSCLRGIWCPIS